MALNAEQVRIGQRGNLYVAPLGTTGPTGPETALDPAYQELGYFSDDGVTENWDDSVSNIVAWQSATVVRTVVTESSGTIAMTMIQTNTAVLETFYKGSTVTSVGAGVYQLDIVPVQAGAKSWVLDWFDGDLATRIWIPNGEVTERGEVVYSNSGDALGYPVTVAAYPAEAIDGNLMRKWSNDPGWGEGIGS